MNTSAKVLSVSLALILITGLAYYLGRVDQASGEEDWMLGTAVAASTEMTPIEGNSPTRALPERDAYFPGTEELAPDEMRVIACGTGMPNARPRQAAACFLVELGNGDKFIFDIGLGSAERIAAMQIPYDYLDKVFIGHLHADHIGDLDALWIGGVISNRQVPLRIFGPTGSETKLGTKYMTDKMAEMYAWDWASRQGNVNTKGPSGHPCGRRFGQFHPGMEWPEVLVQQRHLSQQVVD